MHEGVLIGRIQSSQLSHRYEDGVLDLVRRKKPLESPAGSLTTLVPVEKVLQVDGDNVGVLWIS